MRVVEVHLTTANNVTFGVDRDTTLVGAYPLTDSLLCQEPNLVFGDWQSLTGYSDGVLESFRVALKFNTFLKLNFAFPKDSQITVLSPGLAGVPATVQLFFEDLV